MEMHGEKTATVPMTAEPQCDQLLDLNCQLIPLSVEDGIDLHNIKGPN